jgi:hypothetical protein
MEYGKYESSMMIADQSAWQQVEFWMTSCNINIFDFLENKNITIIATTNSVQELAFQAHNPNLFSGHRREQSITSSESSDGMSYVLSSTNGSLTFKELDSHGLDINIFPINNRFDGRGQKLLWDNSPSFKRIENNRRSNVDISNIYLARRLVKEGKKFFIFANDNDQITQAHIEGFSVLRPSRLLKWMVKESYIKNQKAVWAYEKTRKHNPRSIVKEKNFKDL